MNQRDMVLKYLQDFGSITPMEALNDLGAYRLASRISELRDMGYKIETQTVCSKNRYGKKTHFAKYVLIKETVQESLF